MKTSLQIICVLFCLSLFFACSKSNDESVVPSHENTLKKANVKGTGTISGVSTQDIIPFPVFCDGIQIDELVGSATYHYEMHLKDGQIIFAHAVGFCTAKSTWTDSGEIFTGLEKDPKYIYATDALNGYFQINLKGDQGSNYVAKFTIDNTTNWNFVPIRTVCPGNDK